MKTLKKLLAVLLAAMCASLLFACGGGGGSSSGTSGGTSTGGSASVDPEEPGKKNITVGIIADTSEREMMEKTIAAYAAVKPDVNVRIMSIPGVYSQQIINYASTGELPDVFMNYDTLVGYLASAHVSLDLTPYLEANGIQEEDFYPSIYNLGKVDGNVHMLPREYAHVVVYYNTKLMRDKGIDTSVIKNGWTWNDFVNVANQCVAKRGTVISQYGADLQLNWPTTVMSYIYGNGGKLFSEDKTSCVMDANTQAAYTQLKQYVDDGVISSVFKQGVPTFMNGQVGMYFSVRTQANNIAKNLGNDWDVVSFPTMTGAEQYVGSGTTGYSVSAYSENRQEAVDFLMYMMSEEGMKVIAETGLVIPSRISLNTEDAEWRNYPRADINQEAFVYAPERDMLPLSSFLADPSKSTKVTDALNNATESLLASLTDFQKHADNITKAMN